MIFAFLYFDYETKIVSCVFSTQLIIFKTVLNCMLCTSRSCKAIMACPVIFGIDCMISNILILSTFVDDVFEARWYVECTRIELPMPNQRVSEIASTNKTGSGCLMSVGAFKVFRLRSGHPLELATPTSLTRTAYKFSVARPGVSKGPAWPLGFRHVRFFLKRSSEKAGPS